MSAPSRSSISSPPPVSTTTSRSGTSETTPCAPPSATSATLYASFCRVCAIRSLTPFGQDIVAANRALEKYSGLEPAFATSRECKMLDSIIKAVEGHDAESFTNSVADYDSYVSRAHTHTCTHPGPCVSSVCLVLCLLTPSL